MDKYLGGIHKLRLLKGGGRGEGQKFGNLLSKKTTKEEKWAGVIKSEQWADVVYGWPLITTFSDVLYEKSLLCTEFCFSVAENHGVG